ncbi:MAG: decaprenyl-phosphate phosphoribosyltransferase [Deltaproteobacteria bacterium]|nr:MAG: decaprenyl-phosphate phosphoribosyltransferase [Deltaproteobacteria bacterium]
MIYPFHLLKLARPQQWTKNVFVLTGLLFGHGWDKRPVIMGALMAFAAFCLISSGVYVINDLFDREADRQHPEKKNRPLASGAVGVGGALFLLALLWGGGFTLGYGVSPALAAILGTYAVMNIAYSLRLKHEPVLDVFLLAAGFVLRILGGTLGLGIPPSHWLLLTGTAVSLFLGFVKRRAELIKLGDNPGAHRRVLAHYTDKLLDAAIGISATVAIVSYGLYSMSKHAIRVHGTDMLIYTVPLVMYGIFRYLYVLYGKGGGGDPSKDLFRDSHILVAGALWVGVTLYLIA